MAASVPNWTADFDDQELLARARTDQRAFGELYRRYLPSVFRYVSLYTSSSEDAADLTHVIFMRALEALPFYQERGVPFRAWLIRIARNAATDASRRARVRKTISWDTLPEDTRPGSDLTPEDAAVWHETTNHLESLLEQLDPEKRDVLALRFGAGLTNAEIALIVGKSEAAVKKQVSRTVRRLRERFDAE